MGKPEDILKEFNRSRMNEEAVSIERVHFYKTDTRVGKRLSKFVFEGYLFLPKVPGTSEQ